jgi:hypothetical protein
VLVHKPSTNAESQRIDTIVAVMARHSETDKKEVPRRDLLHVLHSCDDLSTRQGGGSSKVIRNFMIGHGEMQNKSSANHAAMECLVLI